MLLSSYIMPLRIVATAVLMSSSAVATAQHYEGGNWTVTGYRTGADGSLFTLSPAPAACDGGSNFGEHIGIDDKVANRQEIVASLISAYFTGAKVSGIWFSNAGPCSNNSVLSVYMVRMAAK